MTGVVETGARSRDSAGGVAAVDRALAVLAALEGRSEPASLAELAVATGFYKSTLLRLIESLERAGYLIRLRNGRYALGGMAYRLGVAYERANPLRQHVQPVLQDLVAQGSESASFHVSNDERTRLCLFRVDSRHETLDRVCAGDVLPLDRGAAGRILLAFQGAKGAAAAALRDAHFALSMGERDPSCAGMAAPVFGPEGVRGALSLSGPKDRFTPEMIAVFRPKLVQQAAALSRALGGRYPAHIG